MATGDRYCLGLFLMISRRLLLLTRSEGPWREKARSLNAWPWNRAQTLIAMNACARHTSGFPSL